MDDKQPHVLCLNETNLDDTVEDNCIGIDVYQVIRKDRTRRGGGVAMYVHESLMCEFRNDFNAAELESLTIEMRLPITKPIVLMTLNRPEGPVKVYNNIHNLISNILFEDKEFTMMGDVNANFLSKPLDKDAKHMKNIYDSNNLTQLINEPTRTTDNTKTLIDHAVTNRPFQILDSGVIPCGISDHDIIYVLRN